MLSLDERVFEEGSEVRERMARLSERFERLHVLVCAKAAHEPEVLGGRLYFSAVTGAFSPLLLFHALRAGGKILQTLGPNAVITSQDAFLNIVAFQLRRKTGAPVQVQIHTDFLSPFFKSESFKNYFRYRVYRWSVKKADCIRVVSERVKRAIVRELSIPPSRLAVLPIATDVKRFADSPLSSGLGDTYPEAHPRILIVSRLSIEKDIGLAIDIFSEIAKAYPQAHLFIIGDGSERERLEAKAQALRISSRVHFLGWQRDAAPYYHSADLLLHTSRYEGYGLVLVEAAAAGLAIVSTDVGVVGELLKPEESVLTFHLPEEALQAVKRLMSDATLAARIRASAKDAVLRRGEEGNYYESYRASLQPCEENMAYARTKR